MIDIPLYKSFRMITASKMLLLLIVSFLLMRCVSKDEAIERAEEFIKVNGYTTFPADSSRLSYEFIYDDDRNTGSILKGRYNTLHQKAFCIIEDDENWNVGFLSSDIDITKLDSIQLKSNLSGRAVIVSKNRQSIRMAHKDPLFSYFEKLSF